MTTIFYEPKWHRYQSKTMKLKTVTQLKSPY